MTGTDMNNNITATPHIVTTQVESKNICHPQLNTPKRTINKGNHTSKKIIEGKK